MLPVIIDQELDEQAKLRAHRDLVHSLETEMADGKFGPREDRDVRHDFADGVYARTVFLPKGSLSTGRIHKFSQVNIISQGEIAVSTPDGETRYRAPTIVVTPPGTKRAVLAIEDTVWTTVVGTHETDLGTIVEKLTVGTEEEYAAHLELAHGKILELK